MSDDIPVGSPPAPPGRHAAPGGWYPDPASTAQERYWDGWQWTRNVRPATEPAATRSNTQGQWSAQQHPGGQGQYAQPGQPSPVNQYARAVPRSADGAPLAGWGMRLVAYLIDALLLGIVGAVIDQVTGLAAATNHAFNAYMAYLTEVSTTGTPPDIAHAIGLLLTPAFYISQAIAIVLFIAYHALMMRSRSATLGKLAMGLRVVRIGEGTSTRLAWSTCVLRPVVAQLLNLVPFGSLIDYLFPLWDRNRQALHDKPARTQVVKIR